MRVSFLAAIALPVASMLVLSSSVQGAPTTPNNVVVDVEVMPAHRLPGKIAPASAPAAPPPTVPSPFGSFNSQQLDRQLQRYSAYVEQYGVPDILIVGSSRALQGVDPLRLQQGLRQQGLEGLTVYNFGINGATAQVVDWVLHRLLPPEHRPRLLLWADGSRAFNSGRVDQTFKRILASKGHQQLLAGDRPQIALPPGVKLGQVCIDVLTASLPGESRRQPQSSHSPTPPRSPQQDCQQPLKLVVRQVSTRVPAPPDISNSEVMGFQIVNTQFNPAQYFQQFPRVSGRFDGDYRNFTLGGAQRMALERITQWVNNRQIPLVIVNLPLTDTYLDASRIQHETQFRRQMQRLAQSRRFTFIDLADVPTLTPNQYFADPSHLNQRGAIAVARHLGTVLGRLEVVPDLQSQNTPQWQTRSISHLLPITDLTLQLVPGRL